ncbi:HNH endonuclease family protein [Marinobacter sp.]|uniref:HNH endonuclease family protein n=1 Tax=Marinobacter sp. TaxID=50741 RepID=UPI003A9345ED
MLKRFTLTLAVTAALLVTPTYAATVKQSSSGICHDQSSSYYERTKNFKPFSSLDACLRAGGRLPKGYSSSSSSSRNTSAPSSGYSRDQFGRGWVDTDADCQNSRHEALIAQSTGQVRFKTGRECRVTAGRWISPFTGAVIHDPSQIDIDHVVPLKWAWDHGANHWSRAQRERFANDPANLLSVEASLNRQKGAKGPDQWLPPANQCQYMLRFTRVMKTYQLKLSASEERQMAQIRSRVCK